MYERFTDRARKVLQLANQEAQRFNHEYIGTEHILLGLVIEGSGVAAHVLKNLEVDLRKIRMEVAKIIEPGPDTVMTGKIPQTPRAEKVIEYAMEEARGFLHNYVGSEHLLLGLMRERVGVAAQVLISIFGLEITEVRREILTIVGGTVSLNDVNADDLQRNQPLRYTDRARKVMLLAAEEAFNFGHTYLGPEHILLGMLREGSGIGTTVLNEAGLTESNLRNEIQLVLAIARSPPTRIDFQLTPLSEFIFSNSLQVARSLDAERIDADHLLLGMLKETGGIVAKVFQNLRMNRAELFVEIRRRLKTEDN